MSDDELVAALLDELTAPLGLSGGPTEVRVTRYPDAFPQYGPDHVATIESVRAHLEPHHIALTGAATRGVGLASCIADARDIAARVDGWLR
jgi:oxygen-dependent protoporphyrinogen oxidase